MNGLVIVGALPGSPAEKCGLKHGDILLSINGAFLSTVDDFMKARAAANGNLLLLIRREDRLFEVSLKADAQRSRGKENAISAMKEIQRLQITVPTPGEDFLN